MLRPVIADIVSDQRAAHGNIGCRLTTKTAVGCASVVSGIKPAVDVEIIAVYRPIYDSKDLVDKDYHKLNYYQEYFTNNTSIKYNNIISNIYYKL